MNSRVVGLRVASAVFGLLFLGQLMRLVMRVNVSVGSHAVPQWPSAVAVLVLGALCFWLWKLSMTPPSATNKPAIPN